MIYSFHCGKLEQSVLVVKFLWFILHIANDRIKMKSFVNNNFVYPCNSILKSDSVCMEGILIFVILLCFGN